MIDVVSFSSLGTCELYDGIYVLDILNSFGGRCALLHDQNDFHINMTFHFYMLVSDCVAFNVSLC